MTHTPYPAAAVSPAATGGASLNEEEVLIKMNCFTTCLIGFWFWEEPGFSIMSLWSGSVVVLQSRGSSGGKVLFPFGCSVKDYQQNLITEPKEPAGNV